MNIHANSEFSVYQLTQGLEKSPSPIEVSNITLNNLFLTFIDVLIEKELATTLWLKPLNTQDWHPEIERYQQQGKAQKIYLCNTSISLFESPEKKPEIIPISLESSSKLKHECFIIVICPQICGIIVAQEQSNNLKMLISFEKEIVIKVIQEIKQAITITDKTPENILIETKISSYPDSIDGSLLTNLLLKQIARTEKAETPKALIVEQSVYLKDEFLSNLARELLPPLTNMKAALRLLESKQAPEKRKRYLELLQRECDRQNSVITGLMDLLNLEHQQEEEATKLENVVPGIISTYQPLAQEKGIILGYTVPAGLPPVACSSSWVKQIIVNIISNSLKFTPAKGRVSVQAVLQNENIELVFSDTGCGIPTNEIQKIFNSFYRGKNAHSDENWGAGLGLSLVKEILRRCNGSISVTSTVGRGSIFKVLLPVASGA